MRKSILLLAALAISVASSAMKIKTDEIDEFTGMRTVITSDQSICEHYGHIGFRQQNNREFLDFDFLFRSVHAVDEGAKLMFKGTDDSIVIFESTKYSITHTSAGYKGFNETLYCTYVGDIEWFGSHIPRLMRIYTTSGYVDKEISEGDGRKLRRLYEMFANTINGEPGTTLYHSYELKFLKKSAKAKDWEVVKEDYVKDICKEELEDIIDEWEIQKNDKTEYKVLVKKSK